MDLRSSGDAVGVSIGIVTHNSESQINGLFESLRQLIVLRPLEVMFVDNLSTDNTRSIIRNFISTFEKNILPMSLLENAENNIPSARNLVLQNSKFNKIAFIDSDCTFSPNWLEDLLQNFENLIQKDHSSAAYSGTQSLPESSPFYKLVNLSTKSILGNGSSPQATSEKEIKKVNHVPCTNVIFEKSCLVAARGFKKNFALCGEDRQISEDLIRSSFTLYKGPAPKVYNECATDLASWAERMFKFGFVQPRFLHLASVTAKQIHGPTALWFLVSFLMVFAILVPKSFFTFILVYLLLIAFESLRLIATLKNKRIVSRATLMAQLASIFVVTHLFYFVGFSAGLFDRLIHMRRFKNSTKHGFN